MDKRNIKRLLAMLEYLADSNTNESAVVLATASPYIPKLTLGDVKETIKDLKSAIKIDS